MGHNHGQQSTSAMTTSVAARTVNSEDPATSEHNNDEGPSIPAEWEHLESRIRRKADLRLCSIAGILCSLNLLDSGILASASVTTLLDDLDLKGQRYSVSIFIFTVATVVFQLPCTVAVRWFGPRTWFACITFCFGLITLCTAFVQTWRQMIAVRILLGICMSGIYPGLTYLVSTWYTRQEQQLRFAFLQSGEVAALATGYIVNYGLNQLHGKAGLEGWRWMYLVQGLITCVIGIITYWWIVDFPENARGSFYFLTETEAKIAVQRIQADRGDVALDPFEWRKVLVNFTDPKLYGFACMYFLLNIVSTALNYFLPQILESGMGFSSNESILLSTPVTISKPPPHSPARINNANPSSSLTTGPSSQSFSPRYRRHLPHPRGSYHIQRPVPYSRVPHVRASDLSPSNSTLHRHLPSHRCIRV